MLNPINHALDAAAAERYRVEPYVVAADVYSTGPLAGRGGWTWYTGSAGWLYRAAVEAHPRHPQAGQPDPSEPGHSDGMERLLGDAAAGAAASTAIEVSRESGLTAPIVEVDGKKAAGAAFELVDGEGETRVAVRIASANDGK